MPIKFSQFTNRTSNTPGTTIVGFDGNQNIKILSSDLLSGFINGTIHTLPVFTSANTIGDSIVSQDANATQLFIDGDVGIGVNAPYSELHVRSDGNPVATVESYQSVGGNFQSAIVSLRAEETNTNTTNRGSIAIHGPNSLNTGGAGNVVIQNFTTAGGQVVLAPRSGGGDTYFNRFKENGQVQFEEYGSGAFSGTATKTLAVDVDGNIIETPGVTVDGSGTANYITKWLDQDTITDSIIYEDTDGHVGIGVPGVTPDPKHKFEVYDNRAENNAGDYSMIVSSELASPFLNGAGGLKVQLSTDAGSTFPNAISLVTGTTSSELMASTKLAFYSNSDLNTSSATGFGGFVTHDGTDPHWQLGGAVSDSAPSETLFVDGQTRGRSSSFPVYFLERETTITGDGTFTSPVTGIASGFHLRTNSSGTIQDGFGGGMIFSLTDSGNNSNVAARIYARRDGSDTTGALQFWGGLDGTTELLTLRASGNVGIGTDSPSAKLEVRGNSSNTEPAFKVTETGDRIFEVGPDNATTFLLGDLDALGDETYIKGDYSNIEIYSNGTLTAKFDSTNKVGIGPTIPRSKLHVDGAVQVGNDTDAASADKVGALRYYTSGNNSYVDMVMQTGASTYAWINIVQNNW